MNPPASSSSSCFLTEKDLHLHNFSSVVGLGLALGLTLVSNQSAFKPVSVAIKLTNSALSSFRLIQLLHHPSPPESFLLASKTLVKTYKVSKTLNLLQPAPLSTLVGALKPLLGAVGLLRCFSGSSAVFDNGYLEFGVLSYGYKVSKNFLRVLKGVSGVELDDAFRNLLESLGLVVKAVKVAKEVEQITTGGEWAMADTCCLCAGRGVGGTVSLRCKGLCCFASAGLDLDNKTRVFLSCERSSSDTTDLGVEKYRPGDRCVSSQLLCLSIPIPKDMRETCQGV